MSVRGASRTGSRCKLWLSRVRLRGPGKGLPVAQFLTRELADRGTRQVVDEIQGRGDLVLAELAGQKCLEFVQRERVGAGAQFDKRFGGLAPVVVGDAD